MSFRNLEQAEAAVAAAAAENDKKLLILNVYRKWPTLVVCEANDKRILDIVDRWTDYSADVIPTLSLFEEAIAENPEEFNSLAHQSEDTTRRQLVDQIIQLLATKGKGHDEYTLKSERTRLKTFTIDALRTRLADLQRGAQLAGKSVETLKGIVAEAKVDRSPYPGYPTLPKSVWNGQTHVPVNSVFFRQLSSFEIKRYARLYSIEQVNARIAQG